jgi:integrase
VKRPSIERLDAHYLTAAEAGQLLAAAQGDRLYPLVVLLLGTGMRRGEALALHWRDVDLTNSVARVRWTLGRVDRRLIFDEPKTEKSRRFVSLPSRLPKHCAGTVRRKRPSGWPRQSGSRGLITTTWCFQPRSAPRPTYGMRCEPS